MNLRRISLTAHARSAATLDMGTMLVVTTVMTNTREQKVVRSQTAMLQYTVCAVALLPDCSGVSSLLLLIVWHYEAIYSGEYRQDDDICCVQRMLYSLLWYSHWQIHIGQYHINCGRKLQSAKIVHRFLAFVKISRSTQLSSVIDIIGISW